MTDYDKYENQNMTLRQTIGCPPYDERIICSIAHIRKETKMARII